MTWITKGEPILWPWVEGLDGDEDARVVGRRQRDPRYLEHERLARFCHVTVAEVERISIHWTDGAFKPGVEAHFLRRENDRLLAEIERLQSGWAPSPSPTVPADRGRASDIALSSAKAFRVAIAALPVGKDIRTRLLEHLDRHIADLSGLSPATAK